MSFNHNFCLMEKGGSLSQTHSIMHSNTCCSYKIDKCKLYKNIDFCQAYKTRFFLFQVITS